jgi:hypothetical protein
LCDNLIEKEKTEGISEFVNKNPEHSAWILDYTLFSKYSVLHDFHEDQKVGKKMFRQSCV